VRPAIRFEAEVVLVAAGGGIIVSAAKPTSIRSSEGRDGDG